MVVLARFVMTILFAACNPGLKFVIDLATTATISEVESTKKAIEYQHFGGCYLKIHSLKFRNSPIFNLFHLSTKVLHHQ